MKAEFMAPEVGSLAHYGVKGMKWGKRSNPDGSAAPGVFRNRNAADASGVTRKDVKVARNQINREGSRKHEDWNDATVGKDRNQQIKAARKELKYANRTYNDAVREIKGKKGEIGRNAAKIAIMKAHAERYEVAAKAAEKTTGEQVVAALFGGVQLAGQIAGARG